MTVRGVLIAAMWIAAGLIAQPAQAQHHLGLFVGPTLATMSGELIESSEIAWGVAIGVNYELELGDHWQLDAEFGLSQKGAAQAPGDAGNVDYQLQYMELPITLSRLFDLGGSWYVSPFAGIAIAVATGCGVRPAGTFDYVDCDETTPGGLQQDLDVGIPFGVAFRHRYRGGSAMSVEARYTLGLSPAFDEDGVIASNNVLAVLFGFVFPLDDDGYSAGAGR